MDTTSLQAGANTNRNCGRRFNFDATADASITMCCKWDEINFFLKFLFNKNHVSYTKSTIISAKIKPFRVGVNFDGYEVCATAATNTCDYDLAAANEPGGIVGFKLIYFQKSC